MKTISLVAFFACIIFCASAQEPPVVKLGHVGHDHHLALYLACDLGESLAGETYTNVYLHKLKDKQAYNLMKDGRKIAQINLIKVGGGAKMPQALAAGQIDIGFGGTAPTIFAIDSGAKLKIISPANADGDMLVMRPDFPANNWKEFLAYLKNPANHIKLGCKDSKAVAVLILMAALKEENINFAPPGTIRNEKLPAVEIINMGKGSNMLSSLKGGAVDGFVMNQPVPAQAEVFKAGKIICDLKDLPPEGKWHSHPCCCIAASTVTLTKYPEIVRNLLDIFSAAVKHAHTPQAIDIAARWTGMSKEVETKSLPTNLFLAIPDEKWNKGMDNWFSLMKYINQFRGTLKDTPVAKRHEQVADYSFLPEKGCDK